MKMYYCWRCKQEIPMLDEIEFAQAQELYRQAFKIGKTSSRGERYLPLLNYTMR